MNPKLCPTCSAPIPAAAPGGFCPACLLRDAAEPAATGQSAPSLEEVAAAFPTLEIIALIGQGGMGSVYKVRQPNLDRVVALKLLAPELSRDPAFAERFAREARVLGKLNHPNIVSIYEHGRSDGRDLKDGSDSKDGGFYYLIMEYVDGVNLRQAMRAGRFTPEQALAIVPGICDALQAAHAQGIWHRDIKPENILLDQRGGVKIADFGIARLVGDQTRNFTLTGTGNALGSIAYMAPEQHESPHTVDHRADIYSLGVVIYEMLTGELPLGRFPAPSQRAAVSARIDEIVFQTLEKERELRQQSATEVKTDVQSVREINRDPLPMPPVRSDWTARSTAKAAMLGGFVLFLSATIFTRGSTQALLLALSAVPIVLGFLGWLFLPKPALTVEGVLREMNRLANEYLTEKFRELLASGSPLAAPESFQFGRQLLQGTLIKFHRGQTRPPDFMNRPQVTLVAELLRSNGDRESVECLFRAEAEGWRLVDCQVGELTGDGARIGVRSIDESKGKQKPSAGPQPPSLTPTIISHFALFALLCSLFFLVVPRFNEIFKEMGEPLSNYVHVRVPGPINTITLLILFGLVDIYICFFARKSGGARVLRRWSMTVIGLLVTVFALTTVALWLPMRKMVSELDSNPEQSFYEWSKDGYWVLDVEESKQLSNTPPAAKLLHEFIGTGNGKAMGGTEQSLTVAKHQVIWRTESGKLLTPIQPIGTTPADVDLNLTFKNEAISWNVRLSRQGEDRLHVTPVNTDEKTFVTAPRFTLVFKRHDSTSPRNLPLATKNGGPGRLTTAETIINGVRTKEVRFETDTGEIFPSVEAANQALKDRALAKAQPEAAPAVPFLKWVQGEWVMDRAATMRARAALGITGDEPQGKLLHLRFTTTQFEMWNTKEEAPEAASAPYGFHRCALPAPGADDPADSLVVNLKPGDSSAKLGFSKDANGLLRGIFFEGQDQYFVMFKRSDAEPPKRTIPASNKWPTMPDYDATFANIASSNIRDNSTALESFKILQGNEESIGSLIRQHETGTPLFWGSVIRSMSDQLLACLVGTALEQRAELQRNRYISLYQAMAAKDWTKAETLFKERPDKDFEHDLRQLLDSENKRRFPLLNEVNQDLINSEKASPDAYGAAQLDRLPDSGESSGRWSASVVLLDAGNTGTANDDFSIALIGRENDLTIWEKKLQSSSKGKSFAEIEGKTYDLNLGRVFVVSQARVKQISTPFPKELDDKFISGTIHLNFQIAK